MASECRRDDRLRGLLRAIFGSVVSLIVRFRRARLVERQQLKRLSSAAVLVGMMVLFGLLVVDVWGEIGWATNVSNGTLTGSLVCVPVAVGIAVLRYRLYETDRLISRTLVYASLTVVLGLGYAGVVLVPGQLFGAVTGNPPSWAVAGATLAVAALFQPARRRIQSDRRPALQPAPLQRGQDDRGVQRSTARRD
jgi:hypothetical protein